MNVSRMQRRPVQTGLEGLQIRGIIRGPEQLVSERAGPAHNRDSCADR